ncbi:MAG: TIGR00282 family metallophosphoesterase [Candidatus Firestonebacteria bacterium]
MKILFIGDICGKPGRQAICELLPKLKKEFQINLTIANCENAAGGLGVTPQIVEELHGYGVDLLTSGNHIWDKKEIVKDIELCVNLLRPANYPLGVPGKGSVVFKTIDNLKVGVINVAGRVYMQNFDCPFRVAKREVENLKKQTKIIIIDFHAEVTSEKNAFAWYLNGEVSAILGTHTHVQTADEKILPGGTAYITDVGMTGPQDSVIGAKKEIAIQRFLLQMPVKFDVASDDIVLCGVVLDIDENTGKAKSIERLHRKLC